MKQRLLYIAILLVVVCSSTRVLAVEHLPLTITADNYGACQYAQSRFSWNNGIYLNRNAFNWDDKYYTIQFDGIPDKLTFSYEGSSGAATGVEWYVAVSTDGSDFSKRIWTSTDGSGSVSVTIENSSVRYIKFCYSGNFGGRFKNVNITERKEFSVDKTSLDFGTNQRGVSVASQAITLTHCNAGNPTTITCDNSNFTLSSSTFPNTGRDNIGTSVVNVTYNNTTLGTHTGTITITTTMAEETTPQTKTLTVTGTTQTTYYTRAEANSTEGGSAYVSFNSYSEATVSTATKSYGPTTDASAVATAYFKAVANEDYEFVGWKRELSDATYLSSNTEYKIENYSYSSESQSSPTLQSLIAVFRSTHLYLNPLSADYLSEFYKTVTLSRTFSAGYSTLSLPFDTNVATLTGRTSDDDWVAQLHTVAYNQHDDYTLYFQKVADGSIHAFQPYVLHLGQQVVNPSWSNITLTEAQSVSITPQKGYDGYDQWTMTSNFTAAFDMEGRYGIVNTAGGLQRGGTGSKLNAYTAYITPPAVGGNAPRLRVAYMEPDGVTAIDSLPTDTAEPVSVPSAIYGPDGTLRSRLMPGLNIVRQPDGSVRKIYIEH